LEAGLRETLAWYRELFAEEWRMQDG